MKKPTLLTWHDFIAPTGFGNVAKNLLKDAHKIFDVTVVAINSRDPKAKYPKNKYKVIHTPKGVDNLNKLELIKTAKRLKPDVIFLFQDLFNIETVILELKNHSPDSKIVTYFPIDGQPLFRHFANTFKLSDTIITYSDWAIDMLEDYIPNIDKPIHKLYHGVDTKVFKPLPRIMIEKLKKDIGWDGKLVFSNVNTYQPRKQVDLGMRAYSMFAKGFRYCKPCDHMQPRNIKSCELCMSRDLEDNPDNKKDIMLYMHMMPSSRAMGNLPTDFLASHMENAGLGPEDYSKIVAINGNNILGGEVTEEIVNEIYNVSDYNLSTTVGEGCGLSLIESAACGTESIAPRNSAVPEMLGDTGYLIKNRCVANFKEDNGHMRPLADERDLVKIFQQVYDEWVADGRTKRYSQKAVDRINTDFLWDDKRKFLMEKLTQVLSS